MNHLLYPRHFALLTGFALLLAVMSHLHLANELSLSFALYGALHASALILSLRTRQAIWRKCLFIFIAASLSVVILYVGIFGRHLSGTLPGNVGLFTVLGFSAMTGAVAYGVLIRLFGIYKLPPGSLAAIAFVCMLATLVALVTASRSRYLGQWWLAVLWWYAFSGGLWYCDQRRNATNQGRHPRRK
jgi:hypothetical protein